MKDLITVIVCIYNRENYLKKCIDSIINQSYRNLDILLIDDGSTDNSLKICMEYKKRDKRIRVIHQENKGISITRNIGIDNILGEYVCFVDSDDYIDEHYCEKLYNSLINNKADMSMCDILQINTFTNNKYRIDREVPSFVVEGPKVLDLLFKEKRIGNPINKLYKSQILKKIRYPKKSIHEDTYVIYDILQMCKKVSYINELLYFRIIHSNSIMTTKSKSRMDQIKSFEHWEEEFKRKGDFTNYYKAVAKVLNSIIENYVVLYEILDKTERESLRTKFNIKYKICKNNISSKQRIKFILFRIIPNLFKIIYKQPIEE